MAQKRINSLTDDGIIGVHEKRKTDTLLKVITYQPTDHY